MIFTAVGAVIVIVIFSYRLSELNTKQIQLEGELKVAQDFPYQSNPNNFYFALPLNETCESLTKSSTCEDLVLAGSNAQYNLVKSKDSKTGQTNLFVIQQIPPSFVFGMKERNASNFKTIFIIPRINYPLFFKLFWDNNTKSKMVIVK